MFFQVNFYGKTATLKCYFLDCASFINNRVNHIRYLPMYTLYLYYMLTYTKSTIHFITLMYVYSVLYIQSVYSIYTTYRVVY